MASARGAIYKYAFSAFKALSKWIKPRLERILLLTSVVSMQMQSGDELYENAEEMHWRENAAGYAEQIDAVADSQPPNVRPRPKKQSQPHRESPSARGSLSSALSLALSGDSYQQG